jgi:hypothetical protein
LKLGESDATIGQQEAGRRGDEAYVAIPVALDANLSCEALRTAAVDAAREK